MGLLDTANAKSARILSVMTVLLGLSVVTVWGIVPAVMLVFAGMFFYFVGGDAHSQGLFRRVGGGLVYLTLTLLAIGIGV